jgi:mono/diheme cytochrome c family protein
MPWGRNRIFWFLLLSLLTSTAAHARSNEIRRGRALYLQYCASCHGLTAEGDGPVAHALTTPPANLRRLSERLGSPLPEDQVARYIDGRVEVKAHGPRDMPVWGTRFYYELGGDERRAQKRIAELVGYLQSVQTAIRHAALRWSLGAAKKGR